MADGFRLLLLLAKRADKSAIEQIIDMYHPLIKKHAIVNGFFDEDLYQELLATLIRCIHRIKTF